MSCSSLNMVEGGWRETKVEDFDLHFAAKWLKLDLSELALVPHKIRVWITVTTPQR